MPSREECGEPDNQRLGQRFSFRTVPEQAGQGEETGKIYTREV